MIDSPAADVSPGSAQVAVRTLGTAAVIVAGATAYVANAFSVVGKDAGAAAWLVLLASIAVWAAGMLLRDRDRGAAVASIALLLLYASPLYLPGAFTWLVAGVLSTAIVVSTAISMTPRLSIPIVSASLALTSWYAYAPPDGIDVDLVLPVIGGWAAPLFNLSLAIGLILWRTEWVRAARASDDALAHAIVVSTETAGALAVSEARVLVARSLHETVLNTLVAIAAGTSQGSVGRLREVCREDLERVRIEASEDAMIVRRPRPPLPSALTDAEPVLHLLTGQRRLRLAATAPAVFGILTVGFVAFSLPVPLAVLLPFALLIALLGMLVWRWRSQRALASLAFLVLACMAIIMGTVENPPGGGHDAGHALDWLINVGAASMILATLTLAARPIDRIVMPWLLLAANVVAVLLLPVEDRVGPSLSLATTTIYLGSMAASAIWLFRRIDAQSERARHVLATASDEEYARVHRTELVSAWAAVSRATQDLLAGIGSGRLDPADTPVQTRAQTEATILRSRLRMTRSPSSGMQASLERILTAASEAGTPVDVTIIVPSAAEVGLPAAVEAALLRLVDAASSAVEIRLVGGGADEPEELVLTVPPTAGLAFVDGFPPGPTAQGWTASLEDTGPDRVRISLSCDPFATVNSVRQPSQEERIPSS